MTSVSKYNRSTKGQGELALGLWEKWFYCKRGQRKVRNASLEFWRQEKFREKAIQLVC